MKFAILFDDQVHWWPTLEGAETYATQLFTQHIEYVDAIHIYTENDFVNPIWWIARQGYCGPGINYQERESLVFEASLSNSPLKYSPLAAWRIWYFSGGC